MCLYWSPHVLISVLLKCQMHSFQNIDVIFMKDYMDGGRWKGTKFLVYTGDYRKKIGCRSPMLLSAGVT